MAEKGAQNMPEMVNGKKLTAMQKQALAEAQARREKQRLKPVEGEGEKEINGPKGPEPTRYGDWERKGRVSDF